MSFGGLFDGGGGGMNFPYAGAFSSSPALSLGLVRVPSSTTTPVTVPSLPSLAVAGV
jgi:hypothetical protein